MKSLLTAIVAYCQDQSNELTEMIGSYVSGNSQQYGPFMGRAPMNQGNGPDFPFMVYDTIATPTDQGFIDPLQVVEKPQVRFHLYDDDSDRLAVNLETFTNKFDRLTSLSLDDGEKCRSIIRYDSPIYLPEPTSRGSSQTFHAMVSYEFRNQRNRGGQ